MSQLEDIEARLATAAPGAITITPSDVHYLRTLARKQAAALERVEALVERSESHGNLYVFVDDISAALEPQP